MTVEVFLLGPIAAMVDENPVDLGAPQQRAVLAMLALRRGETVPLDTLVDGLWPDDPPPTAAKVVQTYISRLRRAFGPEAMPRDRSGYALSRSVRVDVEHFEELLDAGQTSQALALWRGRALADVDHVPGLQPDLARLEELRLRAVEGQLDTEIQTGNAAAAIGELRRLVEVHPLRESLVERLMRALYVVGRQAEALDVYREARCRLDELGIEPGERLRALERSILNHDPVLSAGPIDASARRPGRHGRTRWVIAAAAVVACATVASVAAAFTRGEPHRVVVAPNSIVRIDARTNRVVEDIPVGRDPSGIVTAGDAVWVSNEGDRTLSRVDTRARNAETIGGVSGVGFVTRDDRGNIYASGWDYPYVWRIDPKRVRVAERFRVRTRAVGIAVGGGSLWVVDRLANGVTRIDLARPRAPGFVHVGSDPIVAAFAYGALWVANSDDGTVSVIRPAVRKPETISVGYKPFGIAAGGGAIWVGSYSDSTITRIDPDTRRVVKVIDVSKLGAQSGLMNVAASATSVWGANTFDLDVVRLDARTNRVAARIHLGMEPRCIAVDGNDVWVSVAAPQT
jgi:DNA-binding SARP family transcriptional activator/DNA-binding beta-propeller fold protein YncE